MTKRALISVGCNAYEHLNDLDGAEADAQRVFDALLSKDVGDYDKDVCRLLLSATTADLQEAIRDTLFAKDPIDTFVLFFAGHGATRSGSFYMCLRDARPDALSATAFSLSDLFLKLGEAKPNQSNIIIDACESGGLIADLGVILKSELLGRAGTPGITLLATSALDQTSGEDKYGGYGTNALLNCISGATFVQDISPTLDLVEIGRKISEDVSAKNDQTPVVWGLNLYGPRRFCRNPCFHDVNSPSLRTLVASWPSSVDNSIEKYLPTLWDMYLSVDRDWNAPTFRDRIGPSLRALSATPDLLVTFVDRLSNALTERALLSTDAFRSVETVATCATLLLPYSNVSNVADSVLHQLTIKAHDPEKVTKPA